MTDKPTTTTVPEQEYVRPRYRTESGDHAHTLEIAMPGVSKSGVHVSLDRDDLTVTGHGAHAIPDGWRPVFSELGSHDYRLRLRLNVDVDPDGISARIEDGLLFLTLPVKEEAKPRMIEIG